MKILISGATGFLGSHLICELLKDSSIEIVATSRNKEKAKKCSWFNKVEYIQYDIDLDINKNLYTMFGRPNKLIHLAWDGLENYNDLNHIEKNLPNNYRFIKNLIEHGLKDISVTGTCFEYGMIDGCLSEDINTKPSNAYALSKDSLRRFIEELKKNYDFNYRWLRLFYMYGEGQSKKSLIGLLNDAVKNKDEKFNMSGGEQLRDYLEVTQVIENIILISFQETYLNQIINCCSGEPISIKELVKNYIKEKNYSIKFNFGYYPYLDHEPMAFWGDNTKLKFLSKGN